MTKKTVITTATPPTGQKVAFLDNFKIGQKLLLITLALGAPLIGTGLYVIANGIQTQNKIAKASLAADAYTTLQETQKLMRDIRPLAISQVTEKNINDMVSLANQIGKLSSQIEGESSRQAKSIETQMNSIAENLQQKKYKTEDLYKNATFLISGDLSNIFPTLSNENGMEAVVSGSETIILAKMSSQQLPVQLPQFGADLGAAINIIHTAREKQNGVFTPEQRGQMQQLYKAVYQDIANLERTMQQLDTKNTPEIKASFDEAISFTTKVVKDMEERTLGTSKIAISDDEISKGINEYLNKQYAAFKNVTNLLSTEYQQELTAAKAKVSLIALFEILAIAISILLVNSIRVSIIKNIENLSEAADELSKGNYNTYISIASRDELGILADSINIASRRLLANEKRVEQERLDAARLQSEIGEFLGVIVDIADGDFTKRGKVSEGVLGNVIDSVNFMTEELSMLLSDARLTSESVNMGSVKMLNSTEFIRNGSLNTTRAAKKVTEQTRQTQEEILEMANSAHASAETARLALEASIKGQKAVQETLAGMQGIRNTSLETAKRIQELSEHSKEISNIVETISGIASQTNLLSLHASIEAAGAGAAGERFSVVAEEVRELADQSSKAATQITSLIGSIQREIVNLVSIINENTEQVDTGYAVASSAGKSLEQIGTLSRKSAQLAEEISQKTINQVSNIVSVNESIIEIANTAENSQKSVDEGRKAAEQLKELADKLNSSLEHFRLPNT